MSIGIYKIINPNGKIYIGQSINIEKRIKNYKNLNCKRQIKLYNSLKKYGWINHDFKIIEECIEEKLNEREIYWGLFYNVLDKNGLNCKLGEGRGSFNEYTKQKISRALKGKSKSKEHCLNLSNAKKGIPSKRKGISDLKQKGIPKPGAGGKGIKHVGAGPKTGNFILNKETKYIYKSIKECMDINKISKRRMFKLLKESTSNFEYINKNYWK